MLHIANKKAAIVTLFILLTGIVYLYYANQTYWKSSPLLFQKVKNSPEKIALLSRAPQELTEYSYGRMLSLSDNILAARAVYRYETEKQDRIYKINISSRTAFMYQVVTDNQWGVPTFMPQKGALDDIQKDWYVKVEYDPDKTETTTENGITITTIPAIKIDYSRPEYPPFLQ